MQISNNKYLHLYNTGIHAPTSVTRKMKEALAGRGKKRSVINVNRGNSIESITGQAHTERSLDFNLRSKELHRDMKNKIYYSTSSDVANHASLNKL